MSPELLDPDQFEFCDGRPTKESDCYALGMVIYEVLSGKTPFVPLKELIVMRKVLEGERPRIPEGIEGVWFVDDVWRMMNRCWAAQPESRPNAEAILNCLEGVSGNWGSPSLADEGNDDWNLTAGIYPV